MGDLTVTNWFGDLISHPQVVAEATSADEIVKTLKNPAQFPSPIRAIGSNYSPAACAVVNRGTIRDLAP